MNHHQRRSFLSLLLSGLLPSGPVHAAPPAAQPQLNLGLVADPTDEPNVRTASAAIRLQHWSRRCVQLVVKYQQNPLRAVRAMAYVHAGMHAAWSAVQRSDAAEREAAAHEVAARMLEALYPHEATGSLRAQARWLSRSALKSHALPDLQEAESVLRQLIDRSLRDGAGRVWSPRLRPAEFKGIWQPAPPLFTALPVEGLAGEWRCWQGSAGVQALVDRVPQAPRPGSARHAEELQEVLTVNRELHAVQRQAAMDWHLDAGSVTPPGVWLLLALAAWREEEHAAGAVAPGRMLAALALLCTGMHDALVACWAVKMRDWSERPITAAHREGYRQFEPIVVTPGFPGYVSGHATVSAAAAAVLTQTWPAPQMRWQALAEEAAMSRLWGGIHFRSDNQQGLDLGRAVALQAATAPLMDRASWLQGQTTAGPGAPSHQASMTTSSPASRGGSGLHRG